MVAFVASSTKRKRKGKGKGNDEVNNNNNNENKNTTGSFANESDRKIWLGAKEKGVVFGYPGKRPAHYKDEDNPSWPWVVPRKLRPYNRIYFCKQWQNRERMRREWPPGTKLSSKSALERAKQRKRLIESGVESLTEGWPEETLQQLERSFQAGDVEFAEIALRAYNEYQQNIKYELAETVGVFMALEPWVGLLHHTNFWARPTAASTAEHQCFHCADRSPKLFFAELLGTGLGDYKVNSCRILDDKSSGPEVVRGVCYICPKEMAHPVENKLGLWRNQGAHSAKEAKVNPEDTVQPEGKAHPAVKAMVNPEDMAQPEGKADPAKKAMVKPEDMAQPEGKAHPAKKAKVNPEHLATLKTWFNQKAKAHPAKEAKGQPAH